MTKYELQNIIPFNDVYYVDCFYLAFFTAVEYLNGSVFSYMANDYFVYEIEDTLNGLTLMIKEKGVIPFDDITKEKGAVPFDDITKNNGIKTERWFNHCPNIVDFIKDSILGGSVIILPIDGYYYKHPHHDLFYLKEHHNNIMLVYGFDSEREVFKTTETNGFQWNTKDCHFKHEISFKELIIGHEGIVKYLQSDPPLPTILKLSKDNSAKVVSDIPSFYKSTMIANLKEHKNDILKGLQNIRIFADNIDQFDICETISFSNLVVSASNQYAIRNILGEECKHMSILDEIVNIWAKIRNLLLKYELKGVEYDKKNFCSKLHQLYELENLLYESIVEN